MLMIKIKHKRRTAVLTDPSKELDCLNDDIFVAKLHAFWFQLHISERYIRTF